MLSCGTLLQVFEKLEGTKYSNLYSIGEPKNVEEIYTAYKDLALRVDPVVLFSFTEDVVMPFSQKVTSLNLDLVSSNTDLSLMITVLGGFGAAFKIILKNPTNLSFDFDRKKDFESIFPEDFLRKVNEEKNKTQKALGQKMDEWISWVVDSSQAESEADSVLMNKVRDFANLLHSSDEVSKKEAAKNLSDFIHTEDGASAVWRNQREVRFGIPSRTESLYQDIIKILIFSDILDQ